MLLCPGDGVGEEVGTLESRHGSIDELGLTSIALRRDYQLARQPGGDLGAVVLADHMKAEIDTGGAFWRRADVTAVEVEHHWIDRHLWIPPGQVLALHPMRGGTTPVE